MGLLRILVTLVTILTCFLQAQGASKYYDGDNMPYEFGFDVEVDQQRHQHRHEKKDENGLIMGEFGFLTADGVYHVTVYATDENGNFKILSTKNIRVAPLKSAAPPERQGHSLPFPASQNAPVTVAPSPARSCSSCSIPQPPKPQLTDLAVVAKDPANADGYNPQNANPQQNYQGQQQPNYPEQQNQDQQQNYPGQEPNYPGQEPNYPSQDPNYTGQEPNYPGEEQNYPGQQNYPDQQQNYPGQQSTDPGQGKSGERNPKQYEGFPPQYTPEDLPDVTKPQLISAQMQIVDKNTDIYQKGPGEEEGLPAGLTNNDMELLLYTFNYTVGFHGHHEEGYKSGAKKGYYYVTGRDGVRTRVDYEADENGFRPKITKEVLDLLSDDVPKPETEKEERFGLKGYEFKWIYYPVDSKRR